ncbi:ComF family protein [Streptomyces sp. NPDC057638]|uniref:ComF family protein n=1 Tax=Streptomyces sp. NPDC057638 TaxID=3346190 RepID=UPI00368ACF92
MRGWWQEISGLVLPVVCPGCGAPGPPLCDVCAARLYGRPPRRARPVPAPDGLPEVWASAPYADAVREALIAHKERGALGLARYLGRALAGAVRAVAPGSGPVSLVPVPSARRAVRARGHDATRRLALAASAELRRGGRQARVVPLLRQRRGVLDQSGLTARQREENMAGALEAMPAGMRLLSGGRVVLVDDLMTTGASLAEAARAFRAAVRDEMEDAISGPISGTGRRIRSRTPSGPLAEACFTRLIPPVAAVVAARSISFEINRN